MKCQKKKISAILLLCVLILNGCKSNSSQAQRESDKIKFSIQEPVNSAETMEPESTEDSMLPPDTKDVTIYTIDPDSKSAIDKVRTIPKDTEISLNAIVQYVISDMKDNSYVIKINDCNMKDGLAIIDFSSDTPPVTSKDKELEEAILNAFAFSIMENLPDCQGVCYHVDGKAYESKNNSFDLDYIYLSK